VLTLIAMSKQITVDGATLVYRWYSPFAFILAMAVAWNVQAARMLLRNSDPIFDAVQLVGSAVLVYFTVCAFVNSTTIEANGERVVVRHGPLPWLGARDLAAADIAGVSYRDGDGPGRYSIPRHYEVIAIRHDKRIVKLVRRAPADAAQAMVAFLQQRV
jgi:hypothetical protein